MSSIRAYYSLVKPGVLYGNAITAVAGFLFASRGDVDLVGFVALTLGSTLMIASACALNNFLDRDIDSKMERTKQRASVQGAVSPRGMVLLASTLGVIGFGVLALWTNWLVVLIGLIGYVTYVVFYGMWSKRQSMHGTLVGSVSGAVPILAGYVAASGVIDLGAALVFAVLFFWQQPEFYSIAIYRRKEYAAASIPLITVVRGVNATIVHIFVHTVAFMASVLLLAYYGYATSTIYLIVMGGASFYWLWLAARGLGTSQPELWARQMFRFSLIILLAFSLMISIDNYLP